LNALDFLLGPTREIVVSGDPGRETTQAMVSLISRTFLPNKVLLLRPEGRPGQEIIGLAPFTQALVPLDHGPTVYLCEQFACRTPITGLAGLQQALAET
jgi:uncharacterized protein YyaL (SSP411 family)